MIKKFFTLLCLCTLCIGSAWGETKTLTETFESANTSTTYNSTQTIDVEKSSCGISWSVYYGSPSTTNPITGSKSCLIRYYTDAAKLGYAQTTTGIKGLTKISFNAKVTNTGNKMGVWYSTDQSNWNQLESDVVLTTNSQNKSYDIPNPDATKTYYIKIGLTTGSTTNKKDLIIDDVVFTYEEATPTGPSLSVSPATIDFGEVCQNAEVDAKEVTVSFANLTTNDVAAAISGSAFGINKTGSFTSGDKITITPNTATIGEYEETLTISATGVESKEVTVTMNVIPAPVTKNYTLVTDASTLKAGDIIVIGATKDNNSYVAGALSGDFLSSEEAQVNNGILSASEAAEFTLGGEAGSWTLTSTAGTLGATAVKKLTYDDTKDNFVDTWTISIDDGSATISSTGEGYGRFLYNVNNPRFLTYTSETNVSMLLPQIYRKEVSATITSTGYATFSSDCPLNLSNLPEGLTAYKATTADNGKVHMVAVEETVDANIGLFLKGEAGTTYTIPVAASGNALDDNLLKATTGEALAEGNYVYVITSGAFQPLANNTVVSKGKAYIPASKIPALGKLEISFEDPTGINNVANVKAADSKMYNLQGVQVSKNYNDIVIMNGKKYLNK